MTDEDSRDRAASKDGAIPPRRVPMVDSRDLFVGTREITIVHGDDHYRLRLTAQNKLILTK